MDLKISIFPLFFDKYWFLSRVPALERLLLAFNVATYFCEIQNPSRGIYDALNQGEKSRWIYNSKLVTQTKKWRMF